MKTKRILSLVVTTAMAAALVTPLHITGAEAQEGIIDRIDFENYDEGTVINSNKTYTNGRLVVEGINDTNKLEVVTDTATGSKAIKMTKDNTSDKLGIWYEFNEAKTTGSYKISFDVRVESASVSFTSFGGLKKETTWSSLINPYIAGSVGFYNNTADKDNWWGNYKDSIGKNTASYQYIVDMDNKTINAKVYNGTVKVVDKDISFTPENMKYLNFTMQSPAAAPNSRGWEYNEENNPDGVMYVDNIFIEEYDASVIQEFDFENFTDGSDFSASNWGIGKQEGDSITVETDPVSGSKALKLTKGKTTADLYAEYGLPNTVTEGKIIVSYDARIASATKYIKSLGEIRNSKWSSMYTSRIKQDGLFSGDTDLNFNYQNNIGSDYAKFEYIIDIDKSSAMFNLYNSEGVLLFTRTQVYEKNPNDYKYIQFSMTTDNQYNVNAWDCIYAGDGTKNTAENNPDGVIYIDNLKISQYRFKVTGASVADGAVDVARDEEIIVNFNAEVSPSGATAENFILYKDGSPLDSSLYTVTADGSSVIIAPADTFDYSSEYKLEVLAGVADISGGTTQKSFAVTFTTEKYEDSVVLMEYDFEDYDYGDLASTASLPVTVASGDIVSIVKDEYGSKALYIERTEENLPTQNETSLKFMLDEPVSSGTIKISQSVRAENYRAGVAQMLSVMNSAWSSTDRSYFHGGYYIPAVGGTYGYDMAKLDPAKYLTIEKYINLDTGNYSIYYYLDGKKVYQGENLTVSPKSVDQLFLLVSKDEWYSLYGESGNAKYYFDNIKVELLKTPDIIWSSPVDGAKGVSVSQDVLLSTAAVLDKNSVNKENIIVAKNGENIENYNVSVVEDKNIKISFEGGMEKESQYSISVSGLKTYGSGYLMSKDFSMSYETAGDFILGFPKISSDPADNTKFNVTYDITNNSVAGGIDLVFASYDETGRLIAVKSERTGTAEGEKAYGEVSVKKGAKVLCYIWNGFNEMHPAAKPVEISVPEATTYGADVIYNTSEDITIAFIGGSITEQERWITPLKTYFNNKFSGRNVNYIVAGVGGTGSQLQQYRIYNDVISKSPDLVIMDSTINDDGTYEVLEYTYENTIRQLMNAEHQPAVLAVAFGNAASKDSEGWQSTFEKQSAINEYYGIPYINVQGYVDEQVAAGNYIWKDDGSGKTFITSDGTHPNDEGGKLYAGYIESLLESDFEGYVKKMLSKSEYVNDEAKEFANAREISWKDGIYLGQWKTGNTQPGKFHEGSVETGTDGNSVTVTFYGKSVSIYNYGGASGMYIDYNLDNGAKTGTVSSFQNSWDFNQAGATSAVTADNVGTHTVTFTARDTGSANAALIIGYFLVY